MQVAKRTLWIGGLAAAGLLLLTGVALASKTPSPQPAPPPPPPPPPPAPVNWRHATDADVARDGTQSKYTQLLNSQPVGYEEQGVYNGNTWKFVVCGGDGCDPPSLYQKDVRGFIAS